MMVLLIILQIDSCYYNFHANVAFDCFFSKLSHGLFHLVGFKDKSEEDANIMRSKENESIQIFNTNYK